MYPFVQWTLEDVGQRVRFCISHKNVPVCWVCCLAGRRGGGGGFWALSVTLQSIHSHSFTHSVAAPGLPWQKQNTTESWTLQGKAVHDAHRKGRGGGGGGRVGVSLWRRLLASRPCTFCYDKQASALLRASTCLGGNPECNFWIPRGGGGGGSDRFVDKPVFQPLGAEESIRPVREKKRSFLSHRRGWGR